MRRGRAGAGWRGGGDRRVGFVVAHEGKALALVVGGEGAVENGGAHLGHQLVVKGDVVVGEELPAEGFVALNQVVDVGARVGAAGGAGAAGVEWFFGEFIHGAAAVDFAVRGEGGAALGELGGDDAIEHVHAAVHGFEDVDRGAHAHEVAGQVFGQLGGDDAGELVALGVGFADGEAADGEAVEGEAAQVVGAAQAEVAVAGALHDAEEGLGRVFAGAQGALGPAVGEVHGGLGGGVVGGGGDALVEHHHDVAADGALHGDAGFGREVVEFAVHVAAKLGALFGHNAGVGQGKNLKAAGIREHGPVPTHETVDAAELLKHLGSGAEEEVVGVGQQDLGADLAEAGGVHVFHRGLGADRHEDRGSHLAVEGLKTGGAGAGAGGGFFELKGETGHDRKRAREGGRRGASFKTRPYKRDRPIRLIVRMVIR